jgi:hypothetical protein
MKLSLTGIASAVIAVLLVSSANAGWRHRHRISPAVTACSRVEATKSESKPEVKTAFVPIRVVVSCSWLEKPDVEREITNSADVQRIWRFVNSHISQLTDLISLSPPVAAFKFYDGHGEMQMVDYDNAEQFHGWEKDFGYGKRGYLTRSQSKLLDQILKDFGGRRYPMR